jgi:4'-phosphopantetheinyl transferase
MLKIFIHKLNNKNDNQLGILSPEENKKARTFRNVKDYRLYVAGKYLTRKIISLHLKVKPDSIIFKADKYGRPSLFYPKIKNFDFNLSHSGNIVVLAIADSRVGIDIERIKPIELEIAKNYFHKKEVNFLFSNKENKIENFYKIWTLKESFIKAVGKGISYPLNNFYFDLKGKRIELHSKFKNNSWHFKMHSINSNYKLAVCFSNNIKAKLQFFN